MKEHPPPKHTPPLPPPPPPPKKKKKRKGKRILKERRFQNPEQENSSYNLLGILAKLPTSEKVITRLSTPTSSKRCRIDSSNIFFKQLTYL